VIVPSEVQEVDVSRQSQENTPKAGYAPENPYTLANPFTFLYCVKFVIKNVEFVKPLPHLKDE
jgi:hypothetical protein